jgi:ferrochelatase
VSEPRRTGVLLVQLGTPRSPTARDVRSYLREFLGDPRVLDLPALGRWLLLNLTILPFRPRRSAAAYAKIWLAEGSPLMLHSRRLADELAAELGPRYSVALAMRYGAPSLQEGLARLRAADVERIRVLPLFPQYAAASTGSVQQRVMELAAAEWVVPSLEFVPEFPTHPGFIEAAAEVARQRMAGFRPDHVLFSYHGLPERQIRRCDPSGAHCLERDDCCAALGPANRSCYRAQCAATTRALALALDLPAAQVSMSFQSRLGRTPWIRPFTDHVFEELAQKGVKRLAVLCPSFVADCLETLEEIGIRGRAQWQAAGGDELLLIPCVNAHPRFVSALAEMLRGRT